MATVAPLGTEIPDVTEPQPSAALSVVPLAASSRDAVHTLTSQILLFSFVAAVLLAIGGFVVVAVYLFQYLHHAFTAFDTNSMASMAQLIGTDKDPDSNARALSLAKLQAILLARAGIWKFILQSCGIIAGAAFGFLGFGLFLLGAKGDMDASFADSQHKVQLSRMAPGSFVILIAAVLIVLCSINKVELFFDPITTETRTVAGGGARAGSAAAPGPASPSSANDPATNPNASFLRRPKPEASSPAKAGENHESPAINPGR
jgi:hypothetical protein